MKGKDQKIIVKFECANGEKGHEQWLNDEEENCRIWEKELEAMQHEVGRVGSLGPAYALGQSSFFKKYKWKNLKFFT